MEHTAALHVHREVVICTCGETFWQPVDIRTGENYIKAFAQHLKYNYARS